MKMEENCRICLQKDDSTMTSLEKENNEKSLAELIEFISGIEINVDDNLPNSICSKCEDNLIAASTLKQRILDSETFLRAQVKFKEENQTEPLENDLKPLKDFSFLEIPTEVNERKVRKLNDVEENYEQIYAIPKINFSRSRKSDKTRERKNKVPKELDYKCFLCNLVFDKVSTKNSHVKNNHKDERDCKICHAKSKTSLSLETHVKFHYCDYDFMCEVCSKVFRYRNRLISHMMLHHEKATEMICDLCGLSTKFKNNIKRHMKSVHMKLREFQCEKCSGHQYSTQEALNSHLYRHHNVPAPIECPDCKHGFTFDSELRAHKKHGFCSNNTNPARLRGKINPDNLEVVDQTGEHICKICNEAFPSKNKFSMHNYLKHKYSNKCEECKISFTNYTSLIRHQKVKHEGHKPFKCEFCFKTFGQKVSLISHRNTHTGEKTFSCSYCSFRSGDHGTVSKHKKKMHPEMMMGAAKTTISSVAFN